MKFSKQAVCIKPTNGTLIKNINQIKMNDFIAGLVGGFYDTFEIILI